MSDPIWKPSSTRIENANLSRFMALVSTTADPSVVDYPSLYRYSIDHPESFWPKVWEFCDVHASQPWDRVVDDASKMPDAQWFQGARLNFAENLLRFRDERSALLFCGEDGTRSNYSYAALHSAVAKLTHALQAEGVGLGDRVAGMMPNCPETVIAMLATASLGATWSSCSPDFGVTGVVDRFGQIEPKVLITVNAYFYGGKIFYLQDKVTSIVERIPTIQRIVVVPFVEESASQQRDVAQALQNQTPWRDYLDNSATDIAFAQLPFDHPLYIMYSSGTTGVPKCIVHGAGGTLLQHLKEHILHTDVKRGDRIFYFTTCGWMMWNWLVSSLATGATVVLFDGNPFHPGPHALFDLIDEIGITIFGTSAKYISAAEKAHVTPRTTHSLETLQTILSTGSPLAPESFDYVYRDIKEDVCLSSISGGTDIISCFALGNPILPVYRGELQCRGLGMKVEILDDNNQAVREQTGELACTLAFPSMPVRFWNDPDGGKYRAAYFERKPGIWCHGDYAMLTEHDGLIIFGRSDATLNPGGVRIGTAEIYRQVEKLDEILESIAVGQEWEDDVRVILFVKLRPGVELTDDLSDRIKKTIRQNTTPRHVPAKIIAVPDIPRTISGKIVELAVRDIIHGRPVKNIDALANPHVLGSFRNLSSLGRTPIGSNSS